jgi:hypothetical protein
MEMDEQVLCEENDGMLERRRKWGKTAQFGGESDGRMGRRKEEETALPPSPPSRRSLNDFCLGEGKGRMSYTSYGEDDVMMMMMR